jgi:uncharacterized protein YacL (UPF0231 family)
MDHSFSDSRHSAEAFPSPMNSSDHSASGSVFIDASVVPAESFMSDFADATHDLLMQDSATMRAAAAHRLADLGRPLASPYLVAALSDGAPEVRQAAAQALGQIGESEAIAPLNDLLEQTPDEVLRAAISDAMHAINIRLANASDTTKLGRACPLPLEESKVVEKAESVPCQPDQEKVLLSEQPRVTQASREPEHADSDLESRAEGEIQRPAAIETGRRQAETEALERLEKEKRLTAEIAALRQEESAQLKRIQEANALARARSEGEARQRSENEARASQEAKRLVELEVIRSKAEAEVREREQKEQQVLAAIESLRESEAEQLKRIGNAEAVLCAQEEATRQAEVNARRQQEEHARLLGEMESIRTLAAA